MMGRALRYQADVRPLHSAYQIWFYLLARNFIRPALNSADFSS